MKILCSQSSFNKSLGIVSRAVSSRPSHPILANILLVADQEKQELILTGYDLTLGIRSIFPAQIEEGGSITIPSKVLNDIISRLDGGDITLLSMDECNLTITSSSGRYQVQGMMPEEFPELPIIEADKGFSLSIETLQTGLKSVLFASSDDETKQILTGCHFKCEGVLFELATTDGHRLAILESESEDDGDNFEVTIPSRTLRELEKILACTDSESINFSFDENQLVFDLPEIKLISRILCGSYPRYHDLLPKDFTHQMSVERKRLISSIERVAVLADQKNNMVRFGIDNTEQILNITVETREVGSGKETISAQISGDNLEIAFNIKYLLEGLKSLTTNEIQIQLNDGNKPVIITPLGGLKMTYLIMPVQIRD